MKHRTSPLTRLLTLALAVIMLVGMMTVGVNAATIKNVKHYHLPQFETDCGRCLFYNICLF